MYPDLSTKKPGGRHYQPHPHPEADRGDSEPSPDQTPSIVAAAASFLQTVCG